MVSATTPKIHLEDCLEDTPQTRTFLDLFEKDTLMLKKFSKAFLGSCQKVLNSQASMISATQELSYYLRLYGQQNFPLDPNTEEQKDSLPSVLGQFAAHVDEISTTFQVLVTQLNDSMLYPLTKLIETEFDEQNSLSQMYQISSEEVDASIQKYLRVPNRPEYAQQRQLANEEVYAFKKKFHQTSLAYFTSLNTLQYKRKFMFVEPMLSCLHTLKLFFKMGSETFSSSLIDEFVNQTSTYVCDVKKNMSDEVNKSNQLIDLFQQDDSIYYIEQNLPNEIEAISETIVQKSGYLNLRSKIPFISKWDRSFYFIQNGYLMQQSKQEIAGSPFLELRSDLTVATCEIDDRQFTFQITSQFPKKVTYFQANSKRDCHQWVKILENAIKDDNKAKLMNHMNNLANKINASMRTSESRQSLDLPKISFDLNSCNSKPSIKSNDVSTGKLFKPELGDLFKVRFLGYMRVKSDRGNEYINETIRRVMAERANQNVFKLTEFNLVVNVESLSLFKIQSESGDDQEKPVASTLTNEEHQLAAYFDLADLAFWCSHRENERLFGFIIKEKQFKFGCLVFESDINSSKICDAITKATQLAYQLLVDENKSEHFKKIKKTEKEILLQNISCLPDKIVSEGTTSGSAMDQGSTSQQTDNADEDDEFINAANMAFNSPNPNFIVLDRDLLENFSQETNWREESSDAKISQTEKAKDSEPANEDKRESTLGKDAESEA